MYAWLVISSENCTINFEDKCFENYEQSIFSEKNKLNCQINCFACTSFVLKLKDEEEKLHRVSVFQFVFCVIIFVFTRLQ